MFPRNAADAILFFATRVVVLLFPVTSILYLNMMDHIFTHVMPTVARLPDKIELHYRQVPHADREKLTDTNILKRVLLYQKEA